ncbi:hypothetical protein WR25_12624 [Diploscapter pachys]|uniref:BZIP domain-containing protein n=1 Tax=Diploscapter pachys TaxID=2018661 RepID=A0A2A2LZG8_9BILA|nr:hypothetical protein WR25_12624 [Diploscapter pachys]
MNRFRNPDAIFQPGFSAPSHHQQPPLGHTFYMPQTTSDWMNMDDQDRRKLERKRARNRVAASKCRQKKMDKIVELEGQVNQFPSENF